MVITNLVTPEDLEYFWSRHRDMGPGETEVIVTWQRLKSMGVDTKCVLDDLRARKAAKKLGVKFTGVLGLLKDLELVGFIDSAERRKVIDKLKASNFRIP